MAAPETDEQEPNSWEELLRRMLPEGAPVPDEEHLDYSISVDYIGPPPRFQPLISPGASGTKFTTFPKLVPSLTPNRSAAVRRSRSSTGTTVYSDNYEWFSASSTPVDGNDSIDDSGKFEANHGDGDDARKETRRSCVFGKMRRACRRCGKGRYRLLRGREECIVCGVLYCRKCVLKAMGSMPEGRKCVGCIGKPIDEANRGRLGRGSTLLGKICSRTEVKRVMQVERECKANQVRPEQVIVNGRELRAEELDELLGCSIPPKDLRPGKYWYDNDSGLWGKEGEKPDSIISSKLEVGGKLQTDASKGNTKVYVNGREITKVELRLLKLAKVHSPQGTHFWLYEDGSYEEEGQNNIKGHIWEKASIRFLSSLFSLPVPPGRVSCAKEDSRLLPQYIEQQEQGPHKIFLLGLEGAGTSTIFKQVKFTYANNFTTGELHNVKCIIQRNIYIYLSILLEGREHFEEEALMNNEMLNLAIDRSTSGNMEPGERRCIYSVNQKIKHFSDWLLELVANGEMGTYFPASAREYAPLADEIWKDPAIQETYRRREELQFLPDVTKYFLDKVIQISSNEYEPSEKDILLAEGVSPNNGLSLLEFSFDDHSAISEIYNKTSDSQTTLSKYQLIQLRSKELCDSRKWLEMFESMNGVIFCVSLCDYDQTWTNNTGLPQNKMMASRDFFESLARHSCFEDTPFLLLLNKYDLFVDKINRVPLTVCEWFSDFQPLKTNGKGIFMAQQAYHYIAVKFKHLYTSITGRKLYAFQTQAYEQASVSEAFRYLREILKWEEKERDFYALSEEDTFSSAEMSSSPCNP